jgi:hypothetical protein
LEMEIMKEKISKIIVIIKIKYEFKLNSWTKFNTFRNDS